MLCFDQKKTHQRGKTHYSNGFDVLENRKVCYGQFL